MIVTYITSQEALSQYLTIKHNGFCILKYEGSPNLGEVYK